MITMYFGPLGDMDPRRHGHHIMWRDARVWFEIITVFAAVTQIITAL